MLQRLFILFITVLLAANSFAQASGKIEVVKHNHVALHVKDIEASTAFYKDVLGLEPIAVPDSLKAIRSWFKLGTDQQIHLLAGRTKKVHNSRTGSHFAVVVQSMSSAENFLISNKIKYHKQVRFDGAVQIYIADPDGYLIELNDVKK